jgi:segregation and condensation protein B
MNTDSKNIAKIEAFLFQHGKPVEIKKISNILNLEKEECLELIKKYQKDLEKNEERGLAIIEKNNKFQLTTKPELGEIIEKIAKEEFTEELSPASLETLAIIAYLEPIRKTTIDFIRGVNSSYILRNLMLRGLINKEKDGHTYNYQITFDCLKHLGIKSTKELPEFEKYKSILEEYNTDNI